MNLVVEAQRCTLFIVIVASGTKILCPQDGSKAI